jgi:uncharacterized protein YndB with AHSA1/START domain
MSSGYTYSKSEVIKAAPAEVWSVLTNLDLTPKYYLGIHWKTDWKKGSPIVFYGDWDHQSFEDKGFILDIESEKFIHFSYFNPSRGIPDLPENYTVMRFELAPDSNGTLFTVYQYGFKSEAEFHTVITKWDAVLYDVRKLAEAKT